MRRLAPEETQKLLSLRVERTPPWMFVMASKPPPADTKKVIINRRILKPCEWIARLAEKFEMIDFWFQTYNNMGWLAHQKQWNFGLGLAGLPIIDWTMPIKSVIHEFLGRHGFTLFWCFSQSKWTVFQSSNGSVRFPDWISWLHTHKFTIHLVWKILCRDN